ncbi:MAG: hypothetical protein ACI3Y0_09230 [Prevotella sp.]
MKIKKLYLSLAGVAMLFASCGNDELELGNSTTEPIDPNCAAVEFASSNKTTFEVDPADPSFSVTVVRKATDAASYSIKVAENQDGSFDVPASVEFAQGETEKVLPIKMKSSAAAGVPLTLSLTFEDNDINPYTTGLKVLTLNTTIIKWESIGTGYWVGNIVNYFFSVESLPLAVEIEKATTSSATKFRFDSPYSRASEELDANGLGYLGYPYNAPEDLNGVVEKCVITCTKDGASMAPFNMGMDWGYGDFSMGSIYGYLSSNIASYPLGVYTPTETGGTIYFAPSSLYISMANYKDGGKYPCSHAASTLYLSAEDFKAASEE